MLTPAVVDLVSFFYALGNTPAVCLTQDLCPEEKANILLLGCGDVRNILFTTYADSACGSRDIDVTCCDFEPAVLARNILLFTLLVDDAEVANHEVYWNIYYHFYVDDASVKTLHLQAEKLLKHADSLDSWASGPYASFIRFCEHGTLSQVRSIWMSYLVANATPSEKKTNAENFKSGLERAVKIRAAKSQGSGSNLTGFRSASPVSLLTWADIPRSFDDFWAHGVTDGDAAHPGTATTPNPSFASQVNNETTIHYGTDPILGFHLATAYVPLISEAKDLKRSDLLRPVAAARSEFRLWTNAFRNIVKADRMRIRCCSADVLTLCHTLQNRTSLSASLYRGPRSFEPLILEEREYGAEQEAPRSFNIIDTSNLVDHVGFLNILVAATPLLEKSASSVMYTESLVKQKDTQKELVDSLLFGDFATMSLIFGLCPIQYWTGASSISDANEHLMDSSMRMLGKQHDRGQMRCRLIWRQATSSVRSIRWDAAELGCLLFGVYSEMFAEENMESMLRKSSIDAAFKTQNLTYQRGSFLSFLLFVKHQCYADWDKVMGQFARLMGNDRAISMTLLYGDEFHALSHLMGVFSDERFQHTSGIRPRAFPALLSWTNLPVALCVTARVPRKCLEPFLKVPQQKFGVPVLQGCLRSHDASLRPGERWCSLFAATHYAFGKLTTEGSQEKDDYRLSLAADARGWRGTSDLFVTFYVPVFNLQDKPEDVELAIGIQANLATVTGLADVLGADLILHSTLLKDAKDVYISKARPNLDQYPSICGSAEAPHEVDGKIPDHTRSITAKMDSSIGRISRLIGRLDFQEGGAGSRALACKTTVNVRYISANCVSVILGKASFSYEIDFPAPIERKSIQTRVARKSQYVEVEAAIADHVLGNGVVDFVYPLTYGPSGPVNLNQPCVNLKLLPAIDVSKKEEIGWLNTHTSLMMSRRERQLRGSEALTSDVRVNFKESLFSTFMHFTGLQGMTTNAFGLHNSGKGGIHVLMFVSRVKLDLANQTVLLDAAVIPLTEQIVPRIVGFLQKLQSTGRLCSIKVDDAELRLWKEVLASSVERCRQWKHKASCEYKKKQRIPLSFEPAESPICSCGQGQLPPDYMPTLKDWKIASQFAVRAAISPCFSVNYVDEPHSIDAKTNKFNPPKLDQAAPQCWICEKDKSTDNSKLLQCAKCHKARYCSRDCQRKDWKSHKVICASLAT